MAQNFYELELNDCDSLKNWQSGSLDHTLGINYTGQYQGSAAINFTIDLDGAEFSAYAQISNAYTNTHDLTNYDEVRFNFYLLSADISKVLNASARIGNNDGFAYWNLTTAQLTGIANTTADQSWREIVLNNLSAASSSGTFNIQDVSTLFFSFNFSSTIADNVTFRIDNWRAIKNFNGKNDVELDGQGYQLFQQEGSYNRSNQPYSVDRYSTGDITYSNFDTYQFKVNTDWSGGWNDEFGLGENTFWDGYRLDNSEVGKIKLGLQPVWVTGVPNSGLVTAIQDFNTSAFIGISYAADNSARIYSYIGSGNTLTLSHTVASSAILDMTIFRSQLWASHGEVHSQPRLLMFDGASWSAVNSAGIYLTTFGDSLYTMDALSNMRSFNGSVWTTEYIQTGWYQHRMVVWRDKIWYLASQSLHNAFQQSNCALFSYDGVDLLTIQTFDDFCTNSLEVWDNKLWFVIGGVLTSYDGENIIQEMDITNRYPKDLALDIYSSTQTTTNSRNIGKGLQAIGDTLYVVQTSSSAVPYSTVLMNAGNGFSPNFYGSNKLSGDGNQVTALGTYSMRGEKRLLMGNNSGDFIYTAIVNTDGGLNDNAYYGGLLESSWVDADLFGIDKIFKSLQIFYENVTEQNTYFYYKLDDDNNAWTFLGNITNYDNANTFIEFNFPSATYGKKIKYQIRFNTSSDEPDNVASSDFNFVITDISLKYLLAPDTKRKWNIKVMMPNNLLLNSGIRDPDNGETLANTLWASRIKKEVLQYKDIDNQIYNVIVNDVQIQGPYNVKTGRGSLGTNPEYVASIELLEG